MFDCKHLKVHHAPKPRVASNASITPAPIVLARRDCIGIAKTGSGKTLAFVLPLIRHVKDQGPIESGDGPIALIMAPTRELVQQISKEVKTFARPLGLINIAVFGGSGA